jgi:hypothetical protein
VDLWNSCDVVVVISGLLFLRKRALCPLFYMLRLYSIVVVLL